MESNPSLKRRRVMAASARDDDLTSTGLSALSSFGDRSEYSDSELEVGVESSQGDPDEEEPEEETSYIGELAVAGIKAIKIALKFSPRRAKAPLVLAAHAIALTAVFADEDAEKASEQIRTLQQQVTLRRQHLQLLHLKQLLLRGAALADKR